MKSHFRIKSLKIKLNTIDFAGEIVALLMMIWCIKSYINSFSYYMALLLLWFFFISLKHFNLVKEIIFAKKTILNFLWPIYLIILSFTGHSSFIFGLWNLCMILNMFIFYIYYRIGNMAIIKRLTVGSLIYIVFINIYSILVLVKNPSAARLMAVKTESVSMDYNTTFLSGYAYIYMITLLCIMFIGLLIFVKYKSIYKLLTLIIIVLSATLIFKSGYSFAILFTLSFGILVLFKIPKRNKSKYVYFSILILAITFILFYGADLIYVISNYFGKGSSIGSRFYELGNFLSGEKVGSSTDGFARLMLYTKSIQTWLNHLFLGIGGKTYTAGGLVGGHSQLLDNFAYYGLIGGGLFIHILYNNWKNIIRLLDKNGKHIYTNVTMLFLCQLLANTGYNETDINMMYIIIPFILVTFKSPDADKIQQNNYNS